MGSGIISTGITGLNAAQLGMLTTGHNITNAKTDGFHRQRTIQASNVAMLTGSGFIGQGTHVSTVERMYDTFLSAQVNRAQTASSELDSYYTQIKQIDNMLADPNAGLSPALQEFFRGVQQVAANPSQLPARQAMVSSAQALVARFHGLEDRVNQMYGAVNSQITTAIASINAYSEQIASLNQSIVAAGSSINQPPNDLLDQRDQLVLELSKLVRVTTTTNTNGSYNVCIGSGQQLVVGAQVSTMTSLPSVADPSRFAIGLKTAGGVQELPESLIGGGSLGGLLGFRSGSLDRVANDLGRNAASLALTFNAQHALGQDLLGQASVDGAPPFQSAFFLVSQPTVIGNANNSAGAAVTSTLSVPTSAANYTNLTNSDYSLARVGASYTLTRLTDNHQWSSATIPFDDSTLTDASGKLFSATEGFRLAESGAMVNGDSFTIQPARAAARNLSINSAIAADPRLIAAAAPIRTAAGTIGATGVITNSNTGSAAITAGSVATNYAAPAAGSPVTLTYNSGAGTFDWPASGAIAAGSVLYTSGSTITIPGAGISFAISGLPKDGDKFSIARNTGGVSDGRNALALGELQTQNTMSGKTASYQSAYAQLVSDSGNKTREIEVKSQAQSALLKQSNDARDALSGVNLDEEAANLLRYQQAYQASAKLIEMGSKLFDALLSIRS